MNLSANAILWAEIICIKCCCQNSPKVKIPSDWPEGQSATQKIGHWSRPGFFDISAQYICLFVHTVYTVQEKI